MEIVMDPSVAQQDFLCMGNTGTPDWHWDLGGITYHFLGRSIDYVLEGTVGLAVEHAHSLGECRSAPVANQCMSRHPRFSWYDTHIRDHEVVNIPWQEFVGGGGIGRPPDGTFYGAQRMQRSRAVVVTLLTHREIHFSDPSRRICSDDPFVGGYSDATVDMTILIGGSPICRGTALGHHIHGCVGASSSDQWTTGGHGATWWCTVVCGTTLRSRSALHHIESTRGVTDS